MIWLINRIKCVFGKHQPAVYYGAISIKDINRELHRIEYGNRMRCPICKKQIKIDFS